MPAANQAVGQKLADITQHQLLFSYQSSPSRDQCRQC
jgi:hypothetical protein